MKAMLYRKGKEAKSPIGAYCHDCVERGRRGGIVTFKSENTTDARQWMNRHQKHWSPR